MKKRALITGITGQDGSYLAELLLSKGYEVFGMRRRSSSFNTQRIDHIYGDLNMIYGDLSDSSSVNKIISQCEPDEVYNLGAQSHVRTSFEIPEYTGDVDALGCLRMLSAIREINPKIKFYQASSSELFGKVAEIPQNERTPFHPRSPYGVAKQFAYWTTVNYRESYNMFCCNGILFNHESPRRGETFVTRKITRAATRIKLGLQSELVLGNLSAQRDWGYAKEYVEAMWLMLQQDEPEDFVVATGKSYSVLEFLEETFKYLGMDWAYYVRNDSTYLRPAEVDVLLGDPSKAERKLGWTSKTKFKELIKIMVDSDLEEARKEALVSAR